MSHPNIDYPMPEPSAAAAFVVNDSEIQRRYKILPGQLLVVNTGNGLGEDLYLHRSRFDGDATKARLYAEFLKRLPEFERQASGTDECLMYEWAVVFVSGSVPERTTLNDKSFLESVAKQGRDAKTSIELVKL